MDSIVDYLVIIFFVVSFLSSIFKKKKKPEVKSANKQRKVRTQNRDVMLTEKAENPLQDFFKSISEEIAVAKQDVNNKLVNVQQGVTHSEVDEYYEQALLNSNDQVVVEDYTYQQTATAPLIKEVVEEKRKSSISIKSYSDSVNFSKARHESVRAKDFKKRLSQKSSLKDFIIMNEILGKPKALQR
jgi:uncharacterized Zn finger protein